MRHDPYLGKDSDLRTRRKDPYWVFYLYIQKAIYFNRLSFLDLRRLFSLARFLDPSHEFGVVLILE